MSIVPLQIPPGITKQATPYSNKGRWTDGNLVRWVNGRAQPVGGHVKIADVPVTDPILQPVRTIFSWVDKVLDKFAALGSNDKLHAYYGTDPTDTVIDITPVDLGAGAVPGYGYGSETYGTGRYGIRTPPPAALAEHATWSMDNYGEDLIACHDFDGRIWRWQRGISPVVPAAQLPNAPVGCQGVLVSEERHIVALGAGSDGRRIEWCDRENPEVWAPTATNQAGGFNLQTAGSIIGGIRVRGGILIITTVDCHLMRYLGGQLVYGFELVGSNCGAFSSQTIVASFDMAFWQGQDRFWMFDGKVTRLECDVLEYVFERMNRDRPYAYAAGANALYNEIWFFYPTSGDLNPTEFVAFSFRDTPHWHIGRMERTAWQDNQVYNRPISITPDGGFMVQEFGWLSDNQPRLTEVYIETAPIDIANGERTARVRRLFQDAFGPSTPQSFPYQIKLDMRPGADGPITTLGPYVIDHERGYTDTRGQGRSVQVKIESIEDAFWELGLTRLDVTPGGRRA